MKRRPQTADEILDAAGGCSLTRRTVFHYLDRYEALRLADAGPGWRAAGSEATAWLPGLLQYLRRSSTRSVTVANDALEQQLMLQQQQEQDKKKRSRSPVVANSQQRSRSRSPNSSNSSGRSPLLSPTAGVVPGAPPRRPLSPAQSPLESAQQRAAAVLAARQAHMLRRRGGGDGPGQSPATPGLGAAAAASSMAGRQKSGSSVDNGSFQNDGSSGMMSPYASGLNQQLGAYIAPSITAESGHGLYAPAARQHIARSAFGPTHVYSGNPIPGDVLAQLWHMGGSCTASAVPAASAAALVARVPPGMRSSSVTTSSCAPEIFFLVAQAFRRPPREVALVLESCDKLVGLTVAIQSVAATGSSQVTAAQSQVFLALQLLCHPIYERRSERRFLVQFPCTLILLRCANLLRVSCFDWRAAPSLVNALAATASTFFKTESFRPAAPGAGGAASGASSFVAANGRNLSPVVVLLQEMLRWHDVEPLREHAPWFAALAAWAAVAPTIWTDMPFAPIFTLPHVLALKSLAIPPPPASPLGSSPSQLTGSFGSTPNVTDASLGGGGGGGGGLAESAKDGANDEEMKELNVVRALMRRNLDAEDIVKSVVRSAIDTAAFHYRREQGLVPTVAAAGAQRERLLGEMSRRVALSFYALAKLETLLPEIEWGTEEEQGEQQEQRTALLKRRYGERYVEREVEKAWSVLTGNGQIGINKLFEARGKLAEAQAAKNDNS